MPGRRRACRVFRVRASLDETGFGSAGRTAREQRAVYHGGPIYFHSRWRIDFALLGGAHGDLGAQLDGVLLGARPRPRAVPDGLPGLAMRAA